MAEKSSFTVKDQRSGSDKRETQDALETGAETEHRVPVNFSSFILSLATSALVQLGQEADPSSGQTSVDLSNARQSIDLLTLLQEKTRGNLTQEEASLVERLLYTLRMKFVSLEQDHQA